MNKNFNDQSECGVNFALLNFKLNWKLLYSLTCSILILLLKQKSHYDVPFLLWYVNVHTNRKSL